VFFVRFIRFHGGLQYTRCFIIILKQISKLNILKNILNINKAEKGVFSFFLPFFSGKGETDT